ncbi:hypothetical protein I8752_35890 [Nostocaceae cyanobacterium CENA369]|uniref:Uncharacterized protein n=1 Tax=Dendronalium phyllosphericum CENA369 TaxID=1725256 RepID=A0A8J7I8Q9_9NOST|nr:hypothetical protein [Dendronalium phyllosphericum]MBH8578235.1 hypothetical protein [Dendronalium phyllosphericum CENA369]
MVEKRQQPESATFRPSDFMRARRPYLFSDTQVVGEPLLDRNFLEYHLETLTSRSQEKDFEHFCRRLAEKELCPNLLPQTGPTGGGDSKVDSETYPVSDAVSLRWYEGVGREAASERWAFAVSAKQQWRSKVRSDVQGIVETQRSYTLIYFISSRYIKDKDRANIEDELRKQYNIYVRVLDRTWILDKVFQNKRENLAVETLKINLPLTPAVKKGALDTSREAELKELETQIKDPIRYQGVEYQLVEDCLEAAILSRELELPRVEVEGRFARAERIAEQYGMHQQKLRCAYAKAWTAYWWHDDFHTFNRIYDDVERLAIESSQVTDIEKLANLWQLLWTTVQRSQLEAYDAKLEARTKTLHTELQRLQADQDRPSTALQARSIELLMDLSESRHEPAELKRILEEFRKVFAEGEGLVNFPVAPLIEILMELGKYLPDDPGFDELFEAVLILSQQRESKATSGRMLLTRGRQKLLGGNRYEAIHLLGRAQHNLAMRECHGELIAALSLCASAYESIGLLWAARSNMLLAASQAFNEYWENSTITIQAFACLQRLVWLELQLGRIPITLAWIETSTVIAQAIGLNEEAKEKFIKERETQDAVLGILLLKTALKDLQCLEFLPAVLEELGFHHSFMASLYALGYEDYLRSEGWIPEEEDEASVRKFFNDWIAQPASHDLPELPEFLAEGTVELRSQVLGCNVVAEVLNNSRSLFIAESILAAFEAFLATSLDSQLFPHQPNIRFQIVSSGSVANVIDFHIKEEGGETLETLIEVKHSVNESYIADLNSESLGKTLAELIIRVIFKIAFVSNPEQYFKGLLQDELAFSRALDFTNVAIAVWNILGKSPKLQLMDWKLSDSDKHFPPQRTNAWNNETVQNISEERANVFSPKPGHGEPPPELKSVDHLKHRERKVFSLLDIHLWDKASWSGTGFGLIPNNRNLPLLELALLFQDENASKKIFYQWRKDIGDEDVEEKIRVSIITGIDADNPAAYRVVIGMNPDWLKASSDSQFILTYRINTMNPRDSRNLDQFIDMFEKLGFYILTPGCVSQDGSSANFFTELGILKKQIFIRPAWQIGEHDFDVCGIQPDDKVIIPEDVKDPPVVSALARLRKLKYR